MSVEPSPAGPVVQASSAVRDTALRILLLDRSRLLADVLSRRLLAEEDVSSVGVASSAAEAARLLTEESYTFVVATPELARELRAVPHQRFGLRPAVPIVILADTEDVQRAPDLFRIGSIVGWVTRNRSSNDLMRVIRTHQTGDVCIPMDILNALAEDRGTIDPAQTVRDRILAQLTEREVEVLLLLEQGLGRAEIASALHLSPNTVRTHIQRILRRLNVHSTLAAIALVRAS